MPELPEVETVKNALESRIINKEIIKVDIYRNNIIEGDIKYFQKTLINKKIIDLSRIGKFLIFHLSNNLIMLSHLRMEGKFIYFDNQKEKSKYARIIFYFKDGTSLNYDDSRTFGYLSIRNIDNYKTTPPISLLGEEAISNINIDKIYPLFNKDKRYIKEVLLDQHVISGLGNIYVDETLFASNISPLSKSYKLSKSQVKFILKNAKDILLKSIKFNGSTIHTFSWDNGKTGGFQKFLKVYGKKNEECPKCHNKLIKIKIGGRGTTYCFHCQKLYTDKYILGLTGPVSSGKSTALNEFKNNGYLTLSCDEIVNNLYENKDFKNTLKKEFNCSSKSEIRKLIIDNKINIEKLNKIIQPIVKKEVINFIKNNNGKIAIEIPLLFQENYENIVDETLLILTKKNKDFIKNRGDKAKAQLLLNNSINYDKFKTKATYLIYNNDSLNNFKKEIKNINK